MSLLSILFPGLEGGSSDRALCRRGDSGDGDGKRSAAAAVAAVKTTTVEWAGSFGRCALAASVLVLAGVLQLGGRMRAWGSLSSARLLVFPRLQLKIAAMFLPWIVQEVRSTCSASVCVCVCVRACVRVRPSGVEGCVG